MNITEKSKEYAKGKAIDAITAAIEQAYADGYNEGYSDGINQLIDNPEDLIGGVKFVDLELPSGTQWSSGYVMDNSVYPKFLSYNDAEKYNIPDRDQLQELMNECQRQYIYDSKLKAVGLIFLAKNGKKITLRYTSSFKVKLPPEYKIEDSASFWVKENLEGVQRLCFESTYERKKYQREEFMGKKLPLMVVRKSR